MSAVVTLAVDAMGGDHGLPVTVPAVARILARHPDLHVIMVGEPSALAAALKKEKLDDHPRLALIPASEVVAMDDPVAVALRQKKDSSMRVAINQVKEGRALAAVSAGNTGALMAVSRFVLKTLPGVDRPAICTAIPTAKGHCHMLDLGANVDSEPKHLLQFALMGQAVVRAVDGLSAPRVALLNIGEEDIKGNVSLKTMEGAASMIGGMIREEAGRSLLRKLSGLFALPLLRGLKHRLDPERYNGASLVGLNGIVVKSHGGTGVEGFVSALEVAVLEAERNVPALIRDALAPADAS